MGKRKNRPMGLENRLPYQGVRNIVAFNWPFYLVVLSIIAFSFLLHLKSDGVIGVVGLVLFVMTSYQLMTSLLTSWWIYDAKDFYGLGWMRKYLSDNANGTVLNLSAGFDETTSAIDHMIAGSLVAADFFNSEQHTEASIKRARLMYPPSNELVRITTSKVAFKDDSFDEVVATFCLHEIRSEKELIGFLRELKRVLKKDGKFIVTEHFRDLPNFGAFSVGFLHFFGERYWLNAFEKAGFVLQHKEKHTVFVHHLIFKNGRSI